MDLQELEKAVKDGSIDTVLLGFADMQGRFQGKRLVADHFLEEVVPHGAEACNYLLAVDVDMNTVAGYTMSSWETGYGDFEMKPDLETLRPVPWHEGTAMCVADLQWHGDWTQTPSINSRRPSPLPRSAITHTCSPAAASVNASLRTRVSRGNSFSTSISTLPADAFILTAPFPNGASKQAGKVKHSMSI
jgi:hypothetical protein